MKTHVRSNWEQTVLVCGKCSKKLGGGFGRKGKTPLAKALRRFLWLKKGRRAEAGIVEVKCLSICPKNAVTVVDASRPGAWMIVPEGTGLDEVAAGLGLTPRHSRESGDPEPNNTSLGNPGSPLSRG